MVCCHRVACFQASPKYSRQRSPRARIITRLPSTGSDTLIVLPVFQGSSPLLPTGQGILRAYENRYISMFQRLSEVEDAKFLHILDPSSALPAMLEDSTPALKGLPSIGCAAVIHRVEAQSDGSLVVHYSGTRRLAIHLVNTTTNSNKVTAMDAAGVWYDDEDPDSPEDNYASSTIDAAERDMQGVVSEIFRLTKIVDPANSALPQSIRKYGPPLPGNMHHSKPTSYDALKSAGHRAATAIETWRRSGSVYASSPSNTSGHSRSSYSSDPYTDFAEKMGRRRRQEMFSFACAHLLELGKAEAIALLMSRDTSARFQYILEAARPYLNQLAAAAALNKVLRNRNNE